MSQQPAATASVFDPRVAPIQFRLWLVFYVMAIVGSGLSVFGAWGLLPVSFVLAGWMLIYYFKPGRLQLFEVLLICVTLGRSRHDLAR
jgi:hypothetical protein